jgi:two-component system sporulation sensor kinase B
LCLTQLDSKEALPLLYLYSIALQLAIMIVPTISIILWKEGKPFTKSEKWLTVSVAVVVIFLGSYFVNHNNMVQLIDYAYIPIVLFLLSFGKRYSVVLLFISLLFDKLLFGSILSTDSIVRIFVSGFLYVYIYMNKIQPSLPKSQNSFVLRMLLYAYLIRILLLILFDFNMLLHLSIYSLIVSPASEIIMILFLIRLQQSQNEIMERKNNDAVIEKQKVVSELAASIAHEIRNPITVVKGFLQLISDPTLTVTEEKRKQYFDLCLSELERAEFIIKDYLSFSKPQDNAIKSIRINDSINKIVSIVESYSNLNNIDMNIEYDQTSNVKIHALKEKMEQILLNIVKNAIEACTGIAHPVVRIVTEKVDNMIRITIMDNGSGMEQSFIDNIGTAYQSTKSTGTGLGMMVSKKLIEEMKGRLLIQSTKGKGSSFEITLPISE